MASWERGLDPDVLPYFRQLVEWIQSVDNMARVTSGYRSSGEQARLYRRFQEGLMPGPVAPPGYSYHEYGRAIDIDADERVLAAAGRAWEEAGGRWGGTFKGAGKYDPIHFQA